MIERDGLFYAGCASIGIVFAPPLDSAVLLELLFPDEWDLIPPG